MSRPDSDTVLPPRLQVMRIIIIALTLGIVAFMIVAVVTGPFNAPANGQTPIITYVALLVAAPLLILHYFVPEIIVASARRQFSQGKLPQILGQSGIATTDEVGLFCALYQVRLLIGAAQLEGAAFLFLVAYLVEGQWWSFVGAAFFLGVLLSKFPTRAGVEQWMERQMELLRQEREGA